MDWSIALISMLHPRRCPQALGEHSLGPLSLSSFPRRESGPREHLQAPVDLPLPSSHPSHACSRATGWLWFSHKVWNLISVDHWQAQVGQLLTFICDQGDSLHSSLWSSTDPSHPENPWLSMWLYLALVVFHSNMTCICVKNVCMCVYFSRRGPWYSKGGCSSWLAK